MSYPGRLCPTTWTSTFSGGQLHTDKRGDSDNAETPWSYDSPDAVGINGMSP